MLFSPVRMIMVPPRHYCVIANPVARDVEGLALFDQSGQAKLRHADLEIRLAQDPFPLYPGEETQLVHAAAIHSVIQSCIHSVIHSFSHTFIQLFSHS